MSDKPKTAKVYLMVECEVEKHGSVNGFTDEERAALMVGEMIYDASSLPLKGNCGWGPITVRKPVVLPANIKAMLDHGSINEKGEILIRELWNEDE